LCEELFILDV